MHIFVLLESFVYVFFCVHEFCCKHGTETETVWIFLLSLPPTAAVATVMGTTQNLSLSSGHWIRDSEFICEFWSLDSGLILSLSSGHWIRASRNSDVLKIDNVKTVLCCSLLESCF